MNRGRINVGAMVPDAGPDRVQANVIVVWDEGASLADQEAAIKAAARSAITRVREVDAGTRRAALLSSRP